MFLYPTTLWSEQNLCIMRKSITM